ncbi:hypothetical protein Q4555_06750 [Octadecabacter sp. 1_MG-2023]|uniref:hypothetical protein n=1 Tax=unclassified Octadecabacter TaxID=196158 RepID=UPI001C0A62E3|nr:MULTISPECIES: hypothetical protein [unclassified Octadecabacter]MBU2994351.1 hypothetical protein [Octadecabacter sp. B2R22]MDO6734360.1 hypothetical protein [Octadecabacter sp. 1_MG-2023]
MKLGLLSAAMMFVASNAMAQHAHTSGSPSETGQSQFAAIAEIVTLLRDDPETNWAQVDIKALRDHLVDMDNVTTKASIERAVNGLSVSFLITGDDDVAASIRRMVLAHSPMLQGSSDWTVTAGEIDNGASMLVQVGSDEDLNQVLGLGFFGLMTIGAHHQQHHLMIAMGRSPH